MIVTGSGTAEDDFDSVQQTNISTEEFIGTEHTNQNINTVLWLQGNSSWSIANVLGSYSDNGWINDEYEIAEFLSGDEQYTLYGVNNSFGVYKGSAAVETAVITQEVDLHKESELVNVFAINDLSSESVVVAIEGEWNSQPREVVELDLSNVDFIVGKLEQYGYSEINYEYENLKYIYEIDLDGDGSTEVIVFESNIDDSNYHDFELKMSRYNKLNVLRKNDYGLENLVAINETFNPEEYWYQMHTGMNFLDLNGDGKIEILVESIASEASLLSVFEIIENNIEEVLSCYYGV